ncbi:AAA family ATPase [Poseidonibacter ostreae]|uniref:AAA family ATPase n=1 Tax=Poseidonibacter ostreae TaxID=2654171 RepID=A0A6L4WQU8_9BACT|nr:AAA family ATPase [Poseidonibacter ostreae]KAB7887403.1 AAA family ATPase [Poseidonibacter ostreae]
MQLIYLYIEKYKNQGFNFTTQFKCNYTDGTLTIDENKNYIENFFGDNIEVSALVGEKSSISEVLATYSHQEYLDEKTFLVYFNEAGFVFKQSTTGKKINFETKYKYDDKSKARTIDLIYFSNDVASIFNNPKFYNLQKYSHIDAYYNYDTNCMVNNNHLFYKEKIEKLETFNERFINILKEDKNIFKQVNDKVKFDVYQNELHFYEMGVDFVSDELFLDLLDKKQLERVTIFSELLDERVHLYKLLILFRLIQCQVSSENNMNDIVSNIKEDFKKIEFSLEDWTNINKHISKYDNLDEVYNTSNLKDLEHRFQYTKDEIWKEKKLYKFHENHNESNELIKILLLKLNRIDFLSSIDQKYNYTSLSSGEREYISVFVAFLHHLNRLSKTEGTEFIFYFDEIDLGLHPNWQKQIVTDLIRFSQKFKINKRIQLIITSHTPFILSDIPRQNIVFLKDGKQVDALEKKQTFGANIHTLLADSFFMDGGLMGEFAKEKVEDVIKFLNDERSKIKDKKEAQQIINIIGEPLLKNQLQKMLDSKKQRKSSKR